MLRPYDIGSARIRVRLEPFGSGRIYPHEQTLSGPKEDRLRLYRATGFNLSPIFGLYPDSAGEVFAPLEALTRTSPPVVARDHLGVTNRLWVVTDSAAISRVIGGMGPKPVYIADGHHRFQTAVTYRDNLRKKFPNAGEQAYDWVLMGFVARLILPRHDEPVVYTAPWPQGVSEASRTA